MRILRYKSIINKVSLKLHKASSKTFCLDTVNFFFYSTSDENANSPGQFSPSGHNSKVIYRVPNQYLKWLFSYSNDPSSFKTYWLLLIRFKRSWRQKLNSKKKIKKNSLPLQLAQRKADSGFIIKFTVNKPRNKLHVAQSCNPPRAIQSRKAIHSVSK